MRPPANAAPTARQYADAAALREALRIFERRTDLVAAVHGLTSRMYQLLLMIRTGQKHPNRASLSELEERLQLGKSTVTELVTRCEERGLLERELDPARRGAILIRLTEAGETQLAQACLELGDERRRLVKLLSRLEVS